MTEVIVAFAIVSHKSEGDYLGVFSTEQKAKEWFQKWKNHPEFHHRRRNYGLHTVKDCLDAPTQWE